MKLSLWAISSSRRSRSARERSGYAGHRRGGVADDDGMEQVIQVAAQLLGACARLGKSRTRL